MIGEALSCGAVSIAEARIAVGISLNSGRGSRSLERSSGLSRSTVLAMVPEENHSSELLVCVSRGSNEFHASRPMQILLRHRSFPGRETSFPLYRQGSDQDSLSSCSGYSDFDSQESPHIVDKYSRARADGITVGQVLDPSLDLWSNTEQPSLGAHRAGGQGWALALVYGFEPTEVGLDELARLWGLGERATRAAVDRLERAGWLNRRKVGRTTVVTVDFSLLPTYMAGGSFVWTDRAARVNDRSWTQTQALQRRRTPLGFRAWLVIRRRAEKVADLPEGCDLRWRQLLTFGTEIEIHQMLVAGERQRSRHAA